MDKGQTVDQNRHIVASIVLPLGFLILVDNLQAIVVNVLFIYKLNVLGSSIIPAEYLYMVGLDGTALFNDALIGVGKGLREETLPLAVAKCIIV